MTEPPSPSPSIQAPDAPIPSPPECPPQRLTREQLVPPTPSVHLENKKHAFSPQLQEFCLKHPIAVVRGLAAALKLGEAFEKKIKRKSVRYNSSLCRFGSFFDENFSGG